MHLVTGKICCCFVDVLTHLMYFKRKQTTNWFACPNESSWHICRGRLGWRMSRSSLIRLLWSLVCFMVCMKKSVLRCRQFWVSDEVSYGIVVMNRSMLYEQHVMGNLPNHETWACLILIKTTLHKSYLNGTLMTQPATEDNIPFSAQKTRCAVSKLE